VGISYKISNKRFKAITLGNISSLVVDNYLNTDNSWQKIEQNNKMLKFIKHHLDSMTGVEIYPIISLLLFFLVFTTMLIIVLKMPKKKSKRSRSIPEHYFVWNGKTCIYMYRETEDILLEGCSAEKITFVQFSSSISYYLNEVFYRIP